MPYTSEYHIPALNVKCNLLIDINECATNNGKCAQICTNTLGSNYCSCTAGYMLDNIDNYSCLGKSYCIYFKKKTKLILYQILMSVQSIMETALRYVSTLLGVTCAHVWMGRV